MSDIQEGEYVRTINGGIGKYATFGTWVYLKRGNKRIFEVIENCDITKHSFDIIDLIEVGDYVNGYRVDNIVDNLDDKRCSYVICNRYVGEMQRFKVSEIRGIVTKEQFEEMEYKVNE